MPSRRFVHMAAAVAALCGLAYAGQASFSSSAEQTYTVHQGDTLWGISRRFHVNMQQLASTNGMQLSQILPIGKVLAIPGTSTAPAATPAAATRAAASTPAPTSVVSPAVACAWPAQAGPYGVLPYPLQGTARYYDLQPLFAHWAAVYGVSPALVEAIAWQESGWQQWAVSSAGAIGVGQLMPGTAKFVAADLLGQRLNLRATSDNIQMMVRFLSYLSAAEGGSLCRTIGAYYEGPGNMATYGIFAESVAYIHSVEAIMPQFE